MLNDAVAYVKRSRGLRYKTPWFVLNDAVVYVKQRRGLC